MNKKIYKKRKQTIERIFADAKENHGMHWTQYLSLEKSLCTWILTSASMN
ncbi:transposase [Enterococcus hirae]|nr:transposase [Enterococcus hirae]